jgi:hypothetical protein
MGGSSGAEHSSSGRSDARVRCRIGPERGEVLEEKFWKKFYGTV